MKKLAGSFKCYKVLKIKACFPKWCNHIWITTSQMIKPKKLNFRKWSIWMIIKIMISIFRMSRSLYLKIHFVLLFRERKRKVYISKTNDLLPFILLLQVKRNSKISKAINSSIMIEENSVKLLNRKFWLEHQSINLTKWWKKTSKWKWKTYRLLHLGIKIPVSFCFNKNLRLKMKLALKIRLLKMKLCTKKTHRDTQTERLLSNSIFEFKRAWKYFYSTRT